MSGWDGRNESFEEWNCRYVVAEGPYKIRIDKISEAVGAYRALKENELQISFKVRVSGVTKLILSGKIMNLRLVSLKNTSSGIVNEYAITEDGLYSFNAWDVGEASGIGWFAYKTGAPSSLVSLSSPITIELLPDYGGALVSDGVDDYAVSDEVIDEEIGGFVWHGELLTAGYGFATSWGANHVFMYRDSNGAIHYGGGTPSEVETMINKPVQILGFLKTPAIPNNTLKITPKLDSTYDYSNAALYQLRLIKTQPTDIQLEAIKWQCRKEHDDYLIQKG